MAKKRTGVIGAMGNLFRWTIYGLAAVLLLAIYLGWSGQDDEQIASAPEAVTPAAPVEDQTAEVAAEESGAAAEDALDEAEVALDEAADQVDTAVDQAKSELEAIADEAEAKAEAAVDEVTQELSEVADEVQTALGELAGAASSALSSGENGANVVAEAAAKAETPSAVTSFTVPGDDATYALTNAFKRDDGHIEFTTERTGADGAAQTVTRLVSCAPLASGVIAEGDGARVDQPEMTGLVLGTPEASIAATACGVFR